MDVRLKEEDFKQKMINLGLTESNFGLLREELTLNDKILVSLEREYIV